MTRHERSESQDRREQRTDPRWWRQRAEQKRRRTSRTVTGWDVAFVTIVAAMMIGLYLAMYARFKI